jgi:arylsulfatase A-like enzyme
MPAPESHEQFQITCPTPLNGEIKRLGIKNGALALLAACLGLFPFCANAASPSPNRPHIVLIMTDDQGWGETGYRGHPVLKTPHIDDMAAHGLRFDRFYAAAPVCSPTRASVLTGRSPDRCGVPSHGYALRLQEKTLAQALQKAGYTTGHFGKWHLDGLKGPGVPILATDSHHPGHFGFDHWLSVTNFFDLNPLLSRMGQFEEFQGTSSEVIVSQALRFVRSAIDQNKTTFTIIWDGSPHDPALALEDDRAPFAQLDERSKNHYGELAAFDRALGQLRGGLRDLGIADNTLVWYCSDNGGLPKIEPSTTGGLRGNKGSLWEGGLRVPGVIEWPAAIKPRVTGYPASTMDILPTLADIVQLPPDAFLLPVDGASLKPLFQTEPPRRDKPIPFRHLRHGALVDNQYKLMATNLAKQEFSLYDLAQDPAETTDIASSQPEVFARLKAGFLAWNNAVEASIAGKDYPEGKVREGEPESHHWKDDPAYQPHLERFLKRPEFSKQPKAKSDSE